MCTEWAVKEFAYFNYVWGFSPLHRLLNKYSETCAVLSFFSLTFIKRQIKTE